jgi:thiol:disulfide interchange protein
MQQFKTIFIFCLIGFALFITWNSFANMTWDSNGSLDIVSGALLEFFFLQIALQMWNSKQNQNIQNHLKNHLAEIEKMIREIKT